MSHVSNVNDAASKVEQCVNQAASLAVGEVNAAQGIALAAIKVSSGDSATSGAKSIFKDAYKAAQKKMETTIKEAKDELSRATSSAKDHSTDAEKTPVKEAIKVADAKYDGAVKLAHAQLDQAIKVAEEGLSVNATNTQESNKAYDAVLDGAKSAQKKFDDAALDALNTVKHATKNVRDAKTPGEALDAKLIVKDAHAKAYQKLDDASLQVQRDMDDLANKTAEKYATLNDSKGNPYVNVASLNAANKEAYAKIQLSHAEWKAKIDQEAAIANA